MVPLSCASFRGYLPGLEELQERAATNGVPDVRIVAGDEIRALEPNHNTT